ncbi:hypothetical protein Hanom_Chr14g01263921 [Helianthus anomalus]
MEKEYEEASSNRRYDKKRECYVNKDGEPVVHKKEIVYEDVLAVIPLSGEFYSNLAKDKNYEKKLKKLVRDVMTVSLRRRDEERMKKNVECMVDELKKVAGESKVEEKEEEKMNGDVKEEVAFKEQQDVKIEVVKEEDVKVEEEEKVKEKVEKVVTKEQQVDEEEKKKEEEECW